MPKFIFAATMIAGAALWSASANAYDDYIIDVNGPIHQNGQCLQTTSGAPSGLGAYLAPCPETKKARTVRHHRHH